MRYVPNRLPSRAVLFAIAAVLTALVASTPILTPGRESDVQATADVLAADHPSPDAGPGSQAGRPGYQALATRSITLLETSFYNGTGLWHMCLPSICNTKNRDWGADALTNLLYLRWNLAGDRTVLPFLERLSQTAHDWVRTDVGSSDTAAWDAVADVREYQATGSAVALAKAQAAFDWAASPAFSTGACPRIEYQWAHGRRTDLKTLETGSNYIKAGLLLYQITGTSSYLTKAERAYAAARRYFLTRATGLYTVYLADNGRTCHPLRGRYFASVNGNMIWDGAELASLTGNAAYLKQSIATATAVQSHLQDGAGVFADLQADNDIVEPLIEAMYLLATADHQAPARRWLLSAASAAGADVNSAGEFGRFFDGPPPSFLATAWQLNGGVALVQAAAALDPRGGPADPGFWQRATFVRDHRRLKGLMLRITFTGRAIALMGTIGSDCCSAGHARVFIDGKQTFDRTGIWQDKSSPSLMQHDQVLFAWRWRTAGRHTIVIRRGIYNSEEGGPFFAMTGYLLVR